MTRGCGQTLCEVCYDRGHQDHNRQFAADEPDREAEAHLDRFVDRLRTRLAAGAETYGNASFTRPAADLVDEIQQELEDVCGWGLLLWIRLERLRTHVVAAEGGTHDRA